MFEIKIEIAGKLNTKDKEDLSASEAIETIYNFPEDKVIFIWEDVEFTAFLSGDISDSWFDILGLMGNLNSSKTKFNLQFPSQSFWHYWKFKEFSKDIWEIEALWSFEEKKKIKVAKGVFQKEFQKLITRVESDLKSQKYIIENFREYL
jgi:hypothetical protein